VLLIAVPLLLSGCAAVPLATVGLGALTGGAREAVHAGTEYATGGVLYRTFTLSLPELRLALGDTLARMEVAIVRDEVAKDLRKIEARAHDRRLDIRLEPVTRTVTRLRLVIADGPFTKDRATASEIVTQLERTVEAREAAPASARSDRIRSGPRTAASSPGPAAPR
jgi:hypothetical protein